MGSNVMFVSALMLICLAAEALSAEVGVFVGKEKASEFLHRGRRANTGIEEFVPGNFDHECLVEVCDHEEARETFEDDAQTEVAWNLLQDQCTFNTTVQCSSPGTEKCVNSYNAFTCNCHSGYDGDLCQNDVNECEQNICEHGSCYNEPGSFRCVCQSGYTGDTCSEDIDECAAPNNLCSNGGVCVNEFGSYSCQCASGWTGSDCAQDINECAALVAPCGNSVCQNDFGSYRCLCDDGYGGEFCDQDIDECAFGYCPRGATCVDGVNQFTCTCPSGGCTANEAVVQQQQKDPSESEAAATEQQEQQEEDDGSLAG